MIDLGLPVAVSEFGDPDGEPMIVLPGGPCRGPEYLTDLAGAGRRRRSLVLHPRGTDGSPGLSRGWWIDADDVIAMADRLAVPSVDLVAHSAGTRLALAVATRFPERVRSLLLVTPPASWLTETPHDGDLLPMDRDDPSVAAALASIEHDDAGTDEAFRLAFRTQAPATYAHWTPAAQRHAVLGEVSHAAATAWFTDIPEDAPARILAATLPRALVIGGDRDQLTGVRPVVAYADALGAELRMIADCGHYPWVEHPAAFAAIVDDWLSADPPAERAAIIGA